MQPSVVVRVDSPAALLAVVPHLLGFMPEASIVVIGLDAAARPHPGHAPV